MKEDTSPPKVSSPEVSSPNVSSPSVSSPKASSPQVNNSGGGSLLRRVLDYAGVGGESEGTA
jgi:hypothetical protein